MKVIVGQNTYEANKESIKAILETAKQFAPPGTIYAIQKGGITILTNDSSDGKEYRKSGYKVFRKRSVYGGCHHRK